MDKKTFPGISFIPLLAMCLVPKEALVTQIHYQEVSLEDVVNRSGYIFVAKRATPFVTTELISILPKGSDFIGKNDPPYYSPPYHDPAPGERQEAKNYQPFTRVLYAFEIAEVLFPEKADIQVGERISVMQAYNAQKLDLHKMYNLEGKRKSPLYQRYAASVNLMDEDVPESLILFVSQPGGRFEFAFEDAYETHENKARVLKLIKDKQEHIRNEMPPF